MKQKPKRLQICRFSSYNMWKNETFTPFLLREQQHLHEKRLLSQNLSIYKVLAIEIRESAIQKASKTNHSDLCSSPLSPSNNIFRPASRKDQIKNTTKNNMKQKTRTDQNEQKFWRGGRNQISLQK